MRGSNRTFHIFQISFVPLPYHMMDKNINRNTKLLIEAKNDMDKVQMRRNATRLTTFCGPAGVEWWATVWNNGGPLWIVDSGHAGVEWWPTVG